MASVPVNQLATGVTAVLYKAAMGAKRQDDDRRHVLKMCRWALVHGAALLGLLAVQPVAALDKAVRPEPVRVAAANTDKPASTAKPDKPATAAAGAASRAKPVQTSSEAKPKAKVVNAKRQWFVQAGAFANEANAQNVRAKLEATGLQSTAEPSDTKAGRLTRVRVGPFDSKADAEKAALQIKAHDLPAVLVRQ